MIIQFNTDHNISGTEAVRTPLIALISAALSRFSAQITRLEVHLTDQDGNKDGLNDKRCMIEARLKGMQPIVVTNNGNTHEQAVGGAVDNLKTSLETFLDRKNKINI